MSLPSDRRLTLSEHPSVRTPVRKDGRGTNRLMGHGFLKSHNITTNTCTRTHTNTRHCLKARKCQSFLHTHRHIPDMFWETREACEEDTSHAIKLCWRPYTIRGSVYVRSPTPHPHPHNPTPTHHTHLPPTHSPIARCRG